MYIECVICKKKMTEMNTSHCKTHGMNLKEYKERFPNAETMTPECREKKNKYKELTIEMSMKLKKSHTLEGFIEKYGEEEGRLRFENTKIGKGLEYYKSLYGDIEGQIKYDLKRQSTSDTMKKRWSEDNQQLKHSKTIKGYIEKNGEEEGLTKWFNKNRNMSKSSSKVGEVEDFKKYKTEVYRITKLVISNMCPIFKLNRSKDFHIDHRYSILNGYLNNIPAHIISCKYNLCIMHSSENCSKQYENSIDIEEVMCYLNEDEQHRKYLEMIK